VGGQLGIPITKGEQRGGQEPQLRGYGIDRLAVTRRAINSTIAITSRMCSRPPTVYEVSIPSNHRTARMMAMVISMVTLLLHTSDSCRSRAPAAPALPQRCHCRLNTAVRPHGQGR